MGASGLVLGLTGFVWMRMRHAPWEGYYVSPLIVVLIGSALCTLFVVDISHVSEMNALYPHQTHMTQATHLMGGVFGIILGKTSWFARPWST